MPYKFFTKEEDKIIIENYPTMRREVCKLLPDRSAGSVMGRARALGFKLGSPNYWSEEEEAILREHYPTMGENIKDLLPNRSVRAIKQRAYQMHIYYLASWSAEEDRILRDNNLMYSDNLLELLPNKDENSIRSRIEDIRKNINAKITYPLNLYIRIYDTYKGYDIRYKAFEHNIDIAYSIIRKSKLDPNLADKVLKALDLYFKEYLEFEDIAYELNISSKQAELFVERGVLALKRIFIKKKIKEQ